MKKMFFLIFFSTLGCAIYPETSETYQCYDKRTCSQMIHNSICRTWNLPNTATRGMRVVVKVVFSRTGDVRDIKLLQDSGDAAFDQSAVTAIEQASPFNALAKVDQKVFNKMKTSVLIFNPDLILAEKQFR